MSSIVLFDGVCNLCSGFVQFVISRDKKQYFKFVSLQADAALPYLEKCGMPVNALASVVLYENGKCYTQSSAALRILKNLPSGWPFFYGLVIFPISIRDAVYNYIAKNRYTWFGRKETCWLPTPELKSRFL